MLLLLAAIIAAAATTNDLLLLLAHYTTTVKFQKELRLVSLEIPEPDATGYQNLVRQNSKLTRSDATRSS
jgi:hypothetical protein